MYRSGLTCVASSATAQCKELACDATNGVYVKPCYGLCTPAERTIVGAKLADDARSITVGLNTAAQSAMFPCVQLFDSTTLGKLGAASQCYVNGLNLYIGLPRDASIKPGDALVLSGQQVVLRDALSPAVFTTPATAITLTTCSNCAGPVVSVVGPKVGGAV